MYYSVYGETCSWLQNTDLNSGLSDAKDLLLHLKPTNMLGFFMGVIFMPNFPLCDWWPQHTRLCGKACEGRGKRGLKDLTPGQDWGGEVKGQKKCFPTKSDPSNARPVEIIQRNKDRLINDSSDASLQTQSQTRLANKLRRDYQMCLQSTLEPSCWTK